MSETIEIDSREDLRRAKMMLDMYARRGMESRDCNAFMKVRLECDFLNHGKNKN